MNRRQRRAAKQAVRHLRAQVGISDAGTICAVNTLDGRYLLPTSGILPIFIENDLGSLKLVGTGFYVTRFGHFLTARHVLEDIYEKQRPGFTFHMVDDEKTALIRNITMFSSHLTADVALGVLEHPPGYVLNIVPTLTTECPKIGEPIVAVAYDKSTHQRNRQISIEPKYMSGHFEYAHPAGRDRVMLWFPCYRISIIIPGGASGGPVFDARGRAFGINCTGYEGTAVSYLARVEEVLSLVAHGMMFGPDQSPIDRTLLQLAQTGHVLFDPKTS